MGLWRILKRQVRDVADISAHIDIDDAAVRIKNNIWFRGPNVWILAFSIIVASVGLNVNSIPVIIGAMLISPLMGPIVGLGFSLGTNDAQLLKEAAKNLLVMVVISLLASSLFFLLSPLKLVNPTELEARTSPTIYDVLIALFGGLAGIFETARKERGTVLSGVAIATALMPPLCTAGYGLAHLDMHFFLGALYLFTINSVFIALATYAMVKFLGFPQAEMLDAKKAKQQRGAITALVIAVIVPSIWTAIILVRNNNYERHVTEFVDENKTLGRSYIYDYKIGTDRQVELFLTGEALDADRLEVLLASAERHGLSRESILLSDHNFAPDMNEEMESVVKGIFERSDKELALKDDRIRELEREVDRLKGEELPYSQLLREVRYHYPEVKELTLARGASVSSDTTAARPGVYVVALTPHKMAGKDLEELTGWLKVRLSDTTLTVINQTAR